MKLTHRFSLLLISIMVLNLFTSCDDDSQGEPGMMTCVFEQNDDDKDGLIDATEESIMEDCRSNQLLNRKEVKSNLIGEWNIVGHGEGWVPTVSQPCGRVIFTESEFTLDFHSGYEDTTYVRNWDIIETESGGLFFEIDGGSVYPMNVNVFCDDYMFFNQTPLDGNMYIYEKMK
ncbi:MAG: hypothetical protein ACJA1A_003750 [Saprospiraceae bacterium]|jgi:hypothetical protein